MRSALAAILLIGLLGCGGPSASKANCAAFDKSSDRLANERDKAKADVETAKNGFLDSSSIATAQARYDQAVRAYAELYAGDTACSTPEDRARARADLDGINRP